MNRTLSFLLLLVALPAAAQTVEVRGGEETPAGRLAREIVSRGEYLLVDRDTVLPEGFRAPADLVVLGAEVRLEGEVAGDVAVLGGELFLRPGSRVGGRLAAVGGGVYPSTLGTHGEILESPVRPGVREEAAPSGRAVRLLDPPGEPLLTFPGLFGVALPTYDRVNGVTLGIQALLRLATRADDAALLGFATYRTGLDRPGGGAELRIPVGPWRMAVRASRETHTNEEWIRGDFANTAAALTVGSDLRNYYGSDRVMVVASNPDPLLPSEGEWLWSPRVGAMVSDDRSFPQTTSWALFGTDEDGLERPNPAIDEGTLVSGLAATAFAWQGRSSGLEGDAELEVAPGVGDFSFGQLRASATYQMLALRTHRIVVRGRAAVPMGADGAPRQRWIGLGGAGTLPTYDPLAFRGDQLGFVDALYGIPLPAIQLPLLGIPELQLRYATGAAWPKGDPVPAWGQNLGAALQFFGLNVGVWINPRADGLDPTLSAALGLPAG